MIKIYHNPRCSKSREGLKILEESGTTFQIVKYLNQPLEKEEIKSLLKLLDMPAKELVRTNEKVWKENYKGKDLSEDEIITAMHEHPKLIQRPIVEKNGKAVIGRPPEKIKDLL
ncbi:arsenate reductase (glutaredoxin) [Haloflavibacter putidus]|uniref:Arsenate reductase (Glutaredoxin) n=1 Tax=Haloflavibacter putidus TaxID=2576776 RepID=A0A507ZWQ9_9FLAO|nr:arsenate reductase (glutaredoxin) [Haloflavibacter putidus]TQD40138.1 arsenate reductase (glutaredoxin) [Haloflavibacter putidus]